MSAPTVCAVMLTRDRPEMARRAVECFRAQTYESKRLLVLDTGRPAMERLAHWKYETVGGSIHALIGNGHAATIGSLRNQVNREACDTFHPDIIVHWDDDDWSDPTRIAEQVALLQSSGAECVGYREMLFWRTVDAPHAMQEEPDTWDGEQAWLYSVPNPSWVIGSSMCYWRSVWERQPFPDLPRMVDVSTHEPGTKMIPVQGGSGEDVVWRRGVKCAGESAVYGFEEPRMICSIHGGNTMPYEVERYPENWRRAPEWDKTCRKAMTL